MDQVNELSLQRFCPSLIVHNIKSHQHIGIKIHCKTYICLRTNVNTNKQSSKNIKVLHPKPPPFRVMMETSTKDYPEPDAD